MFLRRRYSGDGNYAPRGPFVLNKGSPLAQGLVGWWPIVAGDLNGIREMSDVSMLGAEDAVIQGGEVNTSQLIDPFGHMALNFDDVFAAPLGSSPTAAFSVAVWAEKPNNNRWLWALGVATIGQGPHFGLHSSGNWRFANWGGNNIQVSAASETVGQWYLFTCVWDGTNGLIDIDGIERVSAAYTTFDTPSTHRFVPSGLPTLTGAWTSGAFGFALWNRALTLGQRRHLFVPDTRWDLYYELGKVAYFSLPAAVVGGRIMSSLAGSGGLVSHGGIAGRGGGLAG